MPEQEQEKQHAEEREREMQAKRRTLAKVLEDHESLCMDSAEDRATLLAAIMEVI